MKHKTRCLYCGNCSGKTDTWGGCISCGAPLDAVTESEGEYAVPNFPGINGIVVPYPSWYGTTGTNYYNGTNWRG